MSKSLCFIFGMVAGAVAGYYVARQRCEEEIKSVREAFRADSENQKRQQIKNLWFLLKNRKKLTI